MANCSCIQCQGEIISPVCVEINSKRGCNLSDYINSVDKSLEEIEKNISIDIKTLSTKTDLTRDEIIQLLINEIISLKARPVVNSNSLCDNINWDSINNCEVYPNDFCTQLQVLVNLTGTLKSNANV